jgi:polar amino acid transport system ATP-binding protein
MSTPIDLVKEPDEQQSLLAAKPLLSLRQVSKSYGERRILNRMDLDVAPGEKVALIGPSGSGKTTILRLAIGLVEPDEGTISIDGRYLWHEESPTGLKRASDRHTRDVRRSVGIVFQQFNLFPHMSALENVREPLVHVLQVPKALANEKASELLRRVGLVEHLHKMPSQLSGGQQQRVAIARSMALQPKIMLFDEVTSALDPEVVGEVLKVVRSLAQESEMSMLIVTHEISFAADIADRVLMFDDGMVVEEGPPSDVLKAPSHPRTRQFLRAILDR